MLQRKATCQYPGNLPRKTAACSSTRHRLPFNSQRAACSRSEERSHEGRTRPTCAALARAGTTNEQSVRYGDAQERARSLTKGKGSGAPRGAEGIGTRHSGSTSLEAQDRQRHVNDKLPRMGEHNCRGSCGPRGGAAAFGRSKSEAVRTRQQKSGNNMRWKSTNSKAASTR